MVRPFHFSVDGIKLLLTELEADAQPLGRRWPCLKTWGRPPNSGSRSSAACVSCCLLWEVVEQWFLLPTVTDAPSSTYDRADAAARQLVGQAFLVPLLKKSGIRFAHGTLFLFAEIGLVPSWITRWPTR